MRVKRCSAILATSHYVIAAGAVVKCFKISPRGIRVPVPPDVDARRSAVVDLNVVEECLATRGHDSPAGRGPEGAVVGEHARVVGGEVVRHQHVKGRGGGIAMVALDYRDGVALPNVCPATVMDKVQVLDEDRSLLDAKQGLVRPVSLVDNGGGSREEG